MHLIEVLECRDQLAQHGLHVAQVHFAEVIAPERVHKAFGHAIEIARFAPSAQPPI